MLTVFVVLALAALILALYSTTGKCPLVIAVILLCVIELLRALPVGRL